MVNKLLQREIDYQKMFFFDDEQWKKKLMDGSFNGCKIPSVKLNRLRRLIYPLSKQYKEISIAGSIEKRGNKTSFMDYTLVNISGYYQRIEVRTMVCPYCKKHIALGNPFVSDIYLGVPVDKDIQKILSKAREFNLQKNCPSCNEESINQDVIWAKEISFSLE